MKHTAEKYGLAYEITYEVPTASGNAVWHSIRVYGLQKLETLALCKIYGYRVISIKRSVYFKYPTARRNPA